MLEDSPTTLEERRAVITKSVQARKAAAAARKATATACHGKAVSATTTTGKKAPTRRTKGPRQTQTRRQAHEPSEQVRRSGRVGRPTQRLLVSTHTIRELF